ncbi:carbohydrate kinase family protein [Paenibacillus macerans]|uniref:carbohydrate kinase family protein n=1 Tax=Paenibacillus macerans TaxID=44252 RepID=UPI00203E6974|nr:carbohydrate kinase [Paenibacillus macerans]MCM3700263.1 carbohydrate kinase [Paenibacillus macerans]
MFNFDHPIELQNNSNDLLVAGEILIDMISADYDDDFTCHTYHRFFGGSPSNIAMNAKKLGIRPVVASAVGEDGLGAFLINELNNAGIDTSYVQRAADYSTSMVVVTKSQSTPIPVFYRGADYHLSYTAELEEALKNAKVVHFSCWPLSRRPARDTIEKIIAAAKMNRLLVCFDPNYHPMLWEDGEDGVRYVKSLIGKVDIVKPSEDDAERLFGKQTPERYLETFLKLGAKLVILTLGKDGALVSNGSETVRFSTLATEVADTTGAGDAFWSGFYAAAVKGYTIRQALTLGFAVSAYKLKYTGAIADLPKLEVIKDMYGLREE